MTQTTAAASDTPRTDSVICPGCNHQFRAISDDDQAARIAARERIQALESQVERFYERQALATESDGMLSAENRQLRAQLAATTDERDEAQRNADDATASLHSHIDQLAASRLALAGVAEQCAKYALGRRAGRAEGSEIWLELGKVARGIESLADADLLAKALAMIEPPHYVCCASGEGTADFAFCKDEAEVIAFYESMFGKDMDGTMNSAIDHFRDEDNWSAEGAMYSSDEYCARFEVWNLHNQRIPPNPTTAKGT